MNKERSLKYWRIRRENKRTIVGEWVRRKEFKELTKDKHCFGHTIKGIEPAKMSEEEYDLWVEKLMKVKMKL